ncbi:hypothetical protein BD309DRAFT_67329 [Dichomitus squalens]|uniref:Uncharacterized protein n=1 Tax=Dichomitus squalens TaxID=114155 RepID=A0A4Q9N7I2_9APHY|nr:hypothetical protein BD309DRAFT_67329 [Dichomitus squalens]TBU50959.1 hypothetical protein BD310DRAFT_500309 [Dichomitus squalens]
MYEWCRLGLCRLRCRNVYYSVALYHYAYTVLINHRRLWVVFSDISLNSPPCVSRSQGKTASSGIYSDSRSWSN